MDMEGAVRTSDGSATVPVGVHDDMATDPAAMQISGIRDRRYALIGLGLGPTWVGALSDWLRPTHPTNSLQLALYSLVPFYLVAIALDLALARRIARDRDVIPTQAFRSDATP